MAPTTTTLRGRIWRPWLEEAGGAWLHDGVIEVDAAGVIASIGPAPEGSTIPETHPGAVLLPGFVDTHVHYPQTRVRGSATGPLLPWLERTVFPEEARFAAAAYAAAVAEEFCAALVAHGTTTAAIFGSPHPAATDALFAALDQAGLRALAGMTLMDRGAPPANLLAADPAIAACEELCARWHGHDRGRLRFCVTPRFALSCSPELLRAAGALAARRGLWVQTHLAENEAEIAATAAAFPGSGDYLGVYEAHGLCGERSLFAHCVWLDDATWDRMAARDAAVAHCPDSNFFLGSGCMRLRAPLERGVRVGLGSDVGAGRSFSLRTAAARAHDTALAVGDRRAPAELLWLATRGGARALGLGGAVGALEVGFEADVVAVEIPGYVEAAGWIEAVLFREEGAVAATYVRGRRLGLAS